MGAKSGEARLSSLYYDGSAPLILHSERLTAAAGGDLSNLLGVIPWDCYLEDLLVVVEAFAGDGVLPAITLGSSLSDVKYINSYPLTLVAANVSKVIRVDLTHASVTSRVLRAGDILEVDLDAGGTGANILAIVAVLMPRAV